MLLGIPLFIVLLVLIGPFLAAGVPALIAAVSWSSWRPRMPRLWWVAELFRERVAVGGAW